MKSFAKKNSGFTLIECLISIAMLLVVALVVYSVTDKFSYKIGDKNNNLQFKRSCDQLVDDICADFASIILLEKNQPILECVVDENQTKIAFFTINQFDLTTCSVMYIFEKSNDIFLIKRHMMSAKECLDFQNSLTKESILTDEFAKFENVTKKYNILAKKLSLKLLARDANNTLQKYDLLKGFLFIGGITYTKSESSVTVSGKSDPVGIEFSICTVDSDQKKSDKNFEKYRLVKFFSENF